MNPEMNESSSDEEELVIAQDESLGEADSPSENEVSRCSENVSVRTIER